MSVAIKNREMLKAYSEYDKSDLPKNWTLDYRGLGEIHAVFRLHDSKYKIAISKVSSDFFSVLVDEKTYMITKEIDIAVMCLIDIINIADKPNPKMRACHIRHMTYLGNINKAFLIKSSEVTLWK